MSEEKTETTETTVEETKSLDIVEDNVALLKSRIITQDELIKELTEKLDAVNTKYEQARSFMEDEAKSELLAYIAPRYDMPQELLVLQTVDDLKKLKNHIDRVEVPAFKAGTKITTKKTSQKAMLESTFDRAQAKRLEANK